MAAGLARISTLEEELDQYPATESNSEGESYRTVDIYFELNEQECLRIRQQIIRLQQENRDAIAAFNAKQNEQTP
jgi:hypothetical protein